jgi:hypothetical protein
VPLTKIAMWGYYCHRCGHRWVPRGLVQVHRAKGDEERLKATNPGDKPDEPKEEPTVCPACKSPYWSRPKEGS